MRLHDRDCRLIGVNAQRRMSVRTEMAADVPDTAYMPRYGNQRAGSFIRRIDWQWWFYPPVWKRDWTAGNVFTYCRPGDERLIAFPRPPNNTYPYKQIKESLLVSYPRFSCIILDCADFEGELYFAAAGIDHMIITWPELSPPMLPRPRHLASLALLAGRS